VYQKCNIVWTVGNRKSERLKIKWPFKGNSALSLETTRTEEYMSDRKWEQEQFFSGSQCIVTGGNLNKSLHNRLQVGTQTTLFRTTVDKK